MVKFFRYGFTFPSNDRFKEIWALLIVDDFEDYDIGNNEIWWAWKDGLGYAAHGTEA